MANRREQEKQKRRYADARERMDQHESGFKPTAFTVPDGMSIFQFKKAGLYSIDIIPFIVGEGNPYAKKGTVYWERTYYCHRGIGPSNDAYCCARMTFDKRRPCPVCEHIAKLRSDPTTEKKTIQDLREKERQLFLFRVNNGEDKEKGVQLYECSHWKGFGELLETELKFARQQDNEHPFLNFFHLEDGYTLNVMAEEDTWEKRTYHKPVKIQMVPRKKPLPDELLDEVPCLDDLLIDIAYKDLRRIFLQIPEEKESGNGAHPKGDRFAKSGTGKTSRKEDDDEPEEDDEEEELEEEEGDEDPDDEDEEEVAAAPRKKKEKTAKEAGLKVGDYVDHNEHGFCKIIHISQDGTSLRLEDEEGDVHMAIGVADCTKAEAPDEEEEKPAKGKKAPAKAQSSGRGKKAVPDDDDDDEDDEDDEEDDELGEAEDDGWGDDEDEEPEEPKAKKKTKR